MNASTLFKTAPWHGSPLATDDPRFPPGCLLPAEARMLYHLACDYFSGTGAIVDCGAFLGKSAGIMAQGVLDNPLIGPNHRGAVIHSYDWFRVCDDHDVAFIRSVAGRRVSIGETSRPLFDRHTARWSKLIQVHEGNFLEAVWTGGAIELLFIDICKTPELNARVLEAMFPALLPARSIIVQQDYHHAHHPAIHTSLELLSDYVQPLATRVDDSFVFQLMRPVPDDVLTAAASVRRMSPDRQIELMDSAIERLPDHERHFVRLARAVLIAELCGKEKGSAALEGLPERVESRDQDKWNHELNEVRERVARCQAGL